jgi:hypothetical protein
MRRRPIELAFTKAETWLILVYYYSRRMQYFQVMVLGFLLGELKCSIKWPSFMAVNLGN